MPGQNCGHNQSHARNRGARCYIYPRRHRIERPAHLILPYKLAPKPKSGCLNCGSPQSHLRRRCRCCDNSLKRHRAERPLKPARKRRRCACGRANVTKIIYAQILTADDTTPIKVAIPVCHACYQLEHS